MAAVVAAGLISAVVSGISGFLSSRAASSSAKAQANQLKNNMTFLQGEINRGEIELGEALARIDTLIENTSGELRNVMETQVNQATRDIRSSIQSTLARATQEIRGELGARRLFGSEAGVAGRRKTTKEIEGQGEKQLSSLREQALNEIARQTANLKLQGGALKESERSKFKQFRLGALGEIMKLGNISLSLERQASANPFFAAIASAAPDIGGLIGGALSPGIGRTENVEGIAPAPAGTVPVTTPAEDIVKGSF